MVFSPPTSPPPPPPPPSFPPAHTFSVREVSGRLRLAPPRLKVPRQVPSCRSLLSWWPESL